MQEYVAAGVPASKLNVGIPFYGRGYQGMSCTPSIPSTCLYKSFSECPPGIDVDEVGVFETTDINSRISAGSLTRVFWSVARASFATGKRKKRDRHFKSNRS